MMLFAANPYVGSLHFAEGRINAGRSLMQHGDLPRAILIYREGVGLHPTNRELQRDLLEARSLVAYSGEIPMPDGFDHWQYRVRQSDLFIILIVLMAVTCFAAIRRFTTRPGWAGPLTLIGCLACFAIFGLSMELDAVLQNERALPFAVVNRASVLRTGNGESYPPRLDSPLPAGAEVTVLHVRGGWLQVELADQTIGWLSERDLLLSEAAQVLQTRGIP